MSRPIYETPENLANEQAVAEYVGVRWNCTVQKLPKQYKLDYAVLDKDGKIMGWAEIKCITYPLLDLQRISGGYFISMAKIMAAKEHQEFSGEPFRLFVRAADGLWSKAFKDFDNLDITFNGRADRNDWQDKEPVVLINTKEFKHF